MIYTLMLIVNAIIWCCAILVTLFSRNQKHAAIATAVAVAAFFVDTIMYSLI